ncbi:MAG TPA: helix-turn-helix domain-containing protein [Stackebrandtia sp.]|jgi:AcrR family transcriptional regulator|uniref:TetR/AcrR family transcriptional regulator n=1 Tax=Stackebrandtia sp. TaxID=2023065 RepID=UPI002D4D0C7D|nr:helix-turn-helix domain-containing protein [Stackebrandtia sp.]HZE38880.1 helix-turn-helix domain-containing protein [Stackebrandtia sp.]
MGDGTVVGRRERKKAATRAAILDAAMPLFLERGFDEVTVREIADEADVSPKTVFTHFPQKEALVFSDEDERHERLAAAVSDRASGTTISAALKAHYLAEIAAMRSGPQRQILTLMEATPSLVDYAEKMWFRHEDALVVAITKDLELPEPNDEIRFYVRFALHIQLGATHEADPESAIDAGFRLLDEGWTTYHKRLSTLGIGLARGSPRLPQPE